MVVDFVFMTMSMTSCRIFLRGISEIVIRPSPGTKKHEDDGATLSGKVEIHRTMITDHRRAIQGYDNCYDKEPIVR